MYPTLRIATWNANGLLQHISELEILLNNEKIDICPVSETHFTKQSYVKIRDFFCYHIPHPADRARGGSAVLIRNNILHHEEPKIESITMQVTTVSIQAKNKEFKISAIYCPPRHTPTKEDYINLFKALGSYFIIGGDFNAKHTHWGLRLVTPKGRELLQAGQKNKCVFLSTGLPTYWPSDPGKVPDLIDFFIAKGVTSRFTQVESNEDLSSDHSPVILTLSENIIQKEKLPRLTNKRTNWDKFREKLLEYINLQSPLASKEQIDREAEQFIADVQQAAEESTPPDKGIIRSVISYPVEIKELVLAKRSARRKWQQSRYPDDKTKFNRLSNQLKKRIREIKNESINRFLNNLTADKSTEYSLWKATKRIKRPIIQDPPLKMANGKWARGSKQKADLFADHLANVFKPFPRTTATDNITLTERDDEQEIPPVTLKELRSTIRHNLNAKKAPGYDLINGRIMKELPDIALLKLQYIINACFKLKYVPTHWKIAEVIVIPKPGKPPTEVASYRPISLLPIMSKVFERLFLIRLMPIIQERELIPSHQFGFRNKHSTIEQVHRITNIIEKALEEKKICAAVFLDVAQAFDKKDISESAMEKSIPN
ncbi:reverse transcriptase, partial [Lasius niger]